LEDIVTTPHAAPIVRLCGVCGGGPTAQKPVNGTPAVRRRVGAFGQLSRVRP